MTHNDIHMQCGSWSRLNAWTHERPNGWISIWIWKLRLHCGSRTEYVRMIVKTRYSLEARQIRSSTFRFLDITIYFHTVSIEQQSTIKANKCDLAILWYATLICKMYSVLYLTNTMTLHTKCKPTIPINNQSIDSLTDRRNNPVWHWF